MDFFDPKSQHFLLGVGGLLALLTAGYYAVRWLRRSLVEEAAPNGDELLDPLRAAYKRGSMGTDEFERVQAMLGGNRPTTLEDELFAAKRRRKAAQERSAPAPDDAETAGAPDQALRTGGSDGSPPGSD